MKINLDSLETQPVLNASNQRIYWIWADASGYPRQSLNHHEKEQYVPHPLKEFEDAVLSARERIWILDPYFDHNFGLPAIWLPLCCSAVSEVRVISHEEYPEQWIQKQKESTGYEPHGEIQWKVCFFELHDRFAIVDQELWHFGSTVGGAYPRFGAATSGWSAAHLNRVFLSRWEDL